MPKGAEAAIVAAQGLDGKTHAREEVHVPVEAANAYTETLSQSAGAVDLAVRKEEDEGAQPFRAHDQIVASDGLRGKGRTLPWPRCMAGSAGRCTANEIDILPQAP